MSNSFTVYFYFMASLMCPRYLGEVTIKDFASGRSRSHNNRLWFRPGAEVVKIDFV